jgi:LysM repeat protein
MQARFRTLAQYLRLRSFMAPLARGPALFGAGVAEASRWLRPIGPALASRRRGWRGALSFICAFLVVTSTFLIASTTRASYTNVLANGSFEEGFASVAGCGMVGAGWQCFTNGGAANYGFYDDQWAPVVADGAHSQLIEINTNGIHAADADRYAGIFQTVRVKDWAEYTLSLRGMIRTTNQDGDPWRYRVQVGWSAGPHASWGAVTNWVDTGWDNYYERTSPGSLQDFSTRFVAEDDYVTVYVRVWKKWGVPNEEIDINVDAIALTGASPHGYWPDKPVEPVYPQPEKPVYEKPDDKPWHPHHPPPDAGACVDQELIHNGSFEQGFNHVGLGHVGKSWGYFTNGGAANYGFYDEQWPTVVSDGGHGQLIEINTKGIYPADGNRYAGIYQRISWLQVGKTYDLTIRGMLRGAGNEDDPYRFEAQWGYNVGHDTDWSRVTNWQGMDLGKIHPRTEPGAMATYRVQFTAPASDIVLFIRGWMKWGISDVEMDLNLDGISLRGCHTYTKPVVLPSYPVHPVAPVCHYTVQAGDNLSWIAQQYGVKLRALMHINSIHNPDIIYVGQVLTLPGCDDGKPWKEKDYDHADKSWEDHDYDHADTKPWKPEEHDYGRTHVVQAGETFSYICELYGTDPYALAEINGITNWDLIYVGQVLTVP